MVWETERKTEHKTDNKGKEKTRQEINDSFWESIFLNNEDELAKKKGRDIEKGYSIKQIVS